MRRLCALVLVLVTGVGAACLKTPTSGPQAQTPYAVVYGHIGASKLTTNITVDILAYVDSAHALAGGDTGGFAGSFVQPADTGNFYVAFIPATAPATYFLDVLATGQGHTGYVSSLDTIRALRVRFDSINGGPHDSIEVNDSLP